GENQCVHSNPTPPFGSQVSRHVLDELRRAGTTRTYHAGDLLFLENDTSGNVFLIESGLVKVYVTANDGSELILGMYGRGELLCELSALERVPRSASGAGQKQGMLTEIPGAAFRAVIGRHPDALLGVLTTISRRLQRADRERLSYLAQDVRLRV